MHSLHDLEILLYKDKRLVVIETEREGCFVNGFHELAKRSKKPFFLWSLTKGLQRLAPGFEPQKVNEDYKQLLGQIVSSSTPAVYILIDFHHFLSEPLAVRYIKDCIQDTGHTLILLSQTLELPEELRSLATHYSLPLPSREELERMVNQMARQWMREHNDKLKVHDRKIVRRIVDNLCGLTMADAEHLARHAIYDDGVLNQQDIIQIAKDKFDVLNQDSLLNLHLDYEHLEDIAGFKNLKKWLALRKPVFTGDKKLPGGDIPKGMLLLGVQGCGKSMAAKAVASSWGVPLLHLDFSILYNRFYGQTEENLRAALNTAELMEPCVLWLDEIEKGLSAVSASDDVSKRMLGTFLTWLAENKKRVFIVATANDISALPPELMRKGRFDEVFFVDLPDPQTRAEILSIHLQLRELSDDQIDLNQLAEHSDGFSGAEIEQIIVSAVYATYAENRSVTTELLMDQIKATRPLSVLMGEKIEQLRRWAEHRTVSA